MKKEPNTQSCVATPAADTRLAIQASLGTEGDNNMTSYDTNWARAEAEKRKWMAENSLYRDEDEHASCGVGLVVPAGISWASGIVEPMVCGSFRRQTYQLAERSRLHPDGIGASVCLALVGIHYIFSGGCNGINPQDVLRSLAGGNHQSLASISMGDLAMPEARAVVLSRLSDSGCLCAFQRSVCVAGWLWWHC